MKTRLLNKTLRIYMLFSLIILVISAPLFYLLTQHLYIDEADETLVLNKMEFIKYSIPILKTADISVWNKINRDIKIEERNINLKNDSIFYQSYFDSIVNENEPYRVILSPVVIDGHPYTLKARINLVESEDLIKSIVFLFFVIVALLLTGLFFITKRFSTKLWQPFYSLLNQIEQFEINKNSRPQLSETDVEEFHRLGNAIDRLIERNVFIYKSQREFIENAAHELQTPLAVFQAKLETFIQRPDLTDVQSEILIQLIESSSQLNRLNKNLLLLSKIDNSRFSEKVRVSLNDILKKQLDFFTEQAEEKNITIEIEGDFPLNVQANLALVEILVSNLLLNAIRHNTQVGKIKIALKNNSLVIYNTGHPTSISPEKLFERFSKINPSEKGSGLGLAIVKKIVELNHWTITYTFQKNFHSFTIKF